MKTVLIDASSSILLFKSGLFDQLITHYDVIMAQSVFDEITVQGYPGELYFRSLCEKQMIRIPPDPATLNQDLPSSMGMGEADTLRLLSVYPHAFVIIDDGKGARYCRVRKIPYINALLVPKIIYFSGHMSEHGCRKSMDTLISLGRYSPDILDFAQTCPCQELAFFQIESAHDTNQTIS